MGHRRGLGRERGRLDVGHSQRLSSSGDPRTSWGPRRCEFRLRISGDRYAAQSVQSRLARVLMRPEFWLRFQLDAGSHPVWLRVVGADPGDLSFETVFVDRSTYDHWTVGVGLDAEPFAYGERVVLSALTLPADPATGMWLALPDILGDAPARLRVTLTLPPATAAVPMWTPLMSRCTWPRSPRRGS